MNVDLTDRLALIIIPVLRRPHRALPVLESIERTTVEPHFTVFVTSPDDTAEIEAVRGAGMKYPHNAGSLLVDFFPGPGDYARKINAAYSLQTTAHIPFLFLGADDLEFRPGWLTAVLAVAVANPNIGVVGTQDLGNPLVLAGKHATHSLVRRSYIDANGTIDQRGKVLCERYPHEFVDTEFVETAKVRGAWAFARDSVVEHLHPHWGRAPTDELYDQFDRRMVEGRRIYQARQRLWMKPQITQATTTAMQREARRKARLLRGAGKVRDRLNQPNKPDQ